MTRMHFPDLEAADLIGSEGRDPNAPYLGPSARANIQRRIDRTARTEPAAPARVTDPADPRLGGGRGANIPAVTIDPRLTAALHLMIERAGMGDLAAVEGLANSIKDLDVLGALGGYRGETGPFGMLGRQGLGRQDLGRGGFGVDPFSLVSGDGQTRPIPTGPYGGGVVPLPNYHPPGTVSLEDSPRGSRSTDNNRDQSLFPDYPPPSTPSGSTTAADVEETNRIALGLPEGSTYDHDAGVWVLPDGSRYDNGTGITTPPPPAPGPRSDLQPPNPNENGDERNNGPDGGIIDPWATEPADPDSGGAGSSALAMALLHAVPALWFSYLATNRRAPSGHGGDPSRDGDMRQQYQDTPLGSLPTADQPEKPALNPAVMAQFWRRTWAASRSGFGPGGRPVASQMDTRLANALASHLSGLGLPGVSGRNVR
jgi:hypothetical protein